MAYCAVKGCRNNTKFPSNVENLMFHTFPKDEETQKEWLEALEISVENWKWTKNRVVCSKHFKNEDYLGKRLKVRTVPSLKLNVTLESSMCSSQLSTSMVEDTTVPSSFHETSNEAISPVMKRRNRKSDISNASSNASEEHLDIKIKNEPEELSSHEIGYCLSSYKLKQPLDIKDEIEIGDTQLLDGNCFIKQDEIICDTKKEPSPPIDNDFSDDGNTNSEKYENIDSLNPEDNINENWGTNGSDTRQLKRLQCHINGSSDRSNYECEYCDYTARKSTALKRHIDAVHLGLRNYKCNYCEYSAYESGGLKKHIVRVHLKIKNLKCQYCDYATSASHSLLNHVKAIHRKIKDHTCEQCEFATSSKHNLKLHVKTVHLKIKDLNCEYCSFAAVSSSRLSGHISAVHLKIKNHKCEQCSYSASSAVALRAHINAVHLKIKDHKCVQCDYAASSKRSLQLHVKVIHLKIKDFRCDYCSFSAASSNTLNTHVNGVHLKIKNHKCRYCDYTTAQSRVLAYHIKAVHQKIKDHNCEQCSFSTVNSAKLRAHINAVHLKIRNHKCQQCSHAAATARELNRHIYSMHEVNKKRVKCHTVGSSTTVRSQLNVQ